MAKPTSPRLPPSLKLRRTRRSPRKNKRDEAINTITIRCGDCNTLYNVGEHLPPTKLEIEGIIHLSEEARKDIFKQLAIHLGVFCEHVYEKYKLDPKKIEIDVEFDIITTEKAYEA